MNTDNEPGPSEIVVKSDYSSLIQNSNESIGFKSELLKEMNNEFNTEEQSIFVNSFYSYLNNHPTDDFVVDLDIVCKFIGFTRKDHLKKLLLKNFSEVTDYQIVSPPRGGNSTGRPNETIMLNVDTFKGLCMLARTEQAKIIRTYYIKLQELIIKCKNKQIKELTLSGQSNKLQFEGIFKGKESEIRITSDKRISVFDFIRVVGGQTQPDKTWKNIVNNHNEEVRNFYTNFKFKGQGQKLTPVINVQGMVKLLFWLPGEMAKQFRTKSAEVMIRYLGGDLTLINEINQIDNHHVTNPENVAQIFREEVVENQNPSIFHSDQINNSKRLLENFGDKNNVMYNLIFNHKDFGLLSKIGIVREIRVFYERFKEHQREFGEVYIHSVIQCTNIDQVEKDFKDTNLFQTNRINVPKKCGKGNHEEIMKLSGLVTLETISNEIKKVAGDRLILDTASQHQVTENTQVDSLEIEKEITKQVEAQEKTKQIQEQEITKREQIQSDKEIRLSQIQSDKEIELEKIKSSTNQPTTTTNQPTTTTNQPTITTNQPTITTSNNQQNEPAQEIPREPRQTSQIISANQEENIELVKKFINIKTQFSQNRKDYIFIEQLFIRFIEWFHSVYPNTASPLSQTQMSRCIARLPEFIVMRIAIGPRVNNATPRKVGLVNRKWLN